MFRPFVASLVATIMACSPSEFDVAPSPDADGDEVPPVRDAIDHDRVNGPPGECEGHSGPPMVSIGTASPPFCIDSTEVTRGQYEVFLKSVDPSSWEALQAKLKGTRCSAIGLRDLMPSDDWTTPMEPARADEPVTHVAWCDAVAYCLWAGKRLCGAPDGGDVPSAARNDAGVSQWFHACSAGGARRYPYGVTFSKTACNTTSAAVLPVSRPSASDCEGGFPGIRDMVGNVMEWEYGWSVASGTTYFAVRGGAYDGSEADCRWLHGIDEGAAQTGGRSIGFRCCSE